MGLSASQQDLFDHAKGALPRRLFTDPALHEFLQGCAVMFDAAKQTIDAWLKTQAFILTATGVWLDQHAKDRGLYRQSGESDAALAQRIRQYQDAITATVLKSVINAILAAAGVAGTCAIVELRRDRAFMATNAGTGRKVAYLSRGYRMGHSGRPNKIIVILPYGTGAATGAAVDDQMRARRAAGIAYARETRANP